MEIEVTLSGVGWGWGWFLSPLLASFILINEFGYPPLSVWENMLASVPVGFALCNWITYLFACYEGEVNEEVLKRVVGVWITISVVGMWRCMRRLYSRRHFLLSELSPSSSLPLLFLLLLSFLLLSPLFHSHYLHRVVDYHYDDDHYNDDHMIDDHNNNHNQVYRVMSGGATWGDIPLHMDIINSFVKGENREMSIWELPKSPIYAGESLQYSFFPDFHSSCLIISGIMGEREAMIIPGVMLGVSIIGLLYLLNLRLLHGNGKSAVMGVMITVCSGGIGILHWIFQHGLSPRSLEHFDFIERVNNDGKWDLFWHSFIPHILLPQRQAIYAIGIVIFILILVYVMIEGKEGGVRERMKVYGLAGCAASLLPSIHIHSFLALSSLIGGYLLLHPKEGYQVKKMAGWITYILPIIFIGIPTAVLLLGRSAANGGDFFKLSFLFPSPDPLLSFLLPSSSIPILSSIRSLLITLISPMMYWIRSLGLFIPMAVWGSVRLGEGKVERRMWMGGWSIFIIAHLFQFQPWRLDNLKILLVWLIIMSSAVVKVIEKLMKGKKMIRLFAALLFLSLIASGALSLYAEYHRSDELYGEEEMKLAKWVEEKTESKAKFMTAPSHFHPVSSIAGRSRFAGFGGWLHSHGYYEYDARLDLLSKLFRSQSFPYSHTELRNFLIDYVVIDPAVKRWNEPFWTKHYMEVYHSDKYRVFDVKSGKP